MSIDVDLLMDRRRLKRGLAFWRIFAVLAVVVCIIIAFARAGAGFGGAHIARLSVTGIIGDETQLTRQVEAVAKDGSARAMLVYVDSPGGAVAGGQSLHDAIARVAAVKPVVVVMGGTAASAGYMISVPAARIFAREGTLTGSIGVILETGEISGLLSRIGVTTDAIISGPLKDQPSFTKPMSPQGHEVLQALVMDLYDQFVQVVATGRHMDPAKVRELADGRPYTGRQALKLGLIDAIGGEDDARAWLASDKHVSTSLPVRDVRGRGLAERALGESLSGIVGDAMKSLLFQGVKLDGAWALWQPDRL
jgi:protease-4